MNFRDSWLEQANKQTGLKRRRMLRLADNPKAMAQMELAAKSKLGFSSSAKPDYGKIDWATFLPMLLQLLPTILKLFGL